MQTPSQSSTMEGELWDVSLVNTPPQAKLIFLADIRAEDHPARCRMEERRRRRKGESGCNVFRLGDQGRDMDEVCTAIATVDDCASSDRMT